MNCEKYITDFMERYSFPDEAVKTFSDIEIFLNENKDIFNRFQFAIDDYLKNEKISIGDAISIIDKIADENNINRYTFEFVFIMHCTIVSKDIYKSKGLSEQTFWDSMDDLRCKLNECIQVKGVPGTFVAGWFNGILKAETVTYGRFEYHLERYTFDIDVKTYAGKTFTKGDWYLNFHIPSSGIPLTDEVRLDSYKKAYEAYKDYFPDGLAVFGCCTWLLYPFNKEFIPSHSNILKFANDFQPVCFEHKNPFNDMWRIFGKDADLPADKLPKDTSLKKAFAEWLQKGNKVGDAFGVFVFDGEKIIK